MTVEMLNIALVIILFAIFALGIAAVVIIAKMQTKKDKSSEVQIGDGSKKAAEHPILTRSGVGINSIYQFMEFDEINDNMIIRKNRKQFVMVIECKGINYDLLSEDEKNAIEQGFSEVLNVIRYPIQLYVQTRTFNISHLLDEYGKRNQDIQEQIARLDAQIMQARSSGNMEQLEKLKFERRRKQNIFEYGTSIEDYTSRISENRNILMQRTYIVLSYYISEYGDISRYSKDEVDDIAFSELYTRAQGLIRALSSAEVAGTVLNSEELAELLYVAYNRDESDIFSLRNALDAEYDRLYSTAKDLMEEKKARIEAEIEDQASKLAAKSIIKADEISREQRARMIRARAKEMVGEYKNELGKGLYEETQKQIDAGEIEEAKDTGRGALRQNVPLEETEVQEQPKRRIVRKA